MIFDSEGIIVLDSNLTDFNTTTSSRLQVGNYTSFVYYTGIAGSNLSELIETDEHQLDTSSKITLDWGKIGVTYTIQIREYDHENRDVPIIHEATNISETKYDYSNFVEGKEYAWSVFAVDDLGFSSESSSQSDLRIGTTKFLAFMLFNDWEVPFLLLGVMMVVALQAGVFLAREEKDD